MKEFTINRHGRLVLPSNFTAALDFSVLKHLDQLEAVIDRDFDAKAPSGDEIRRRVGAGRYGSRYELLRDVALNLAWAARYTMSMYVMRPTRWRDVPRRRDDVFLPVVSPWPEGEPTVTAVQSAWAALPPTWDLDAEQRIFDVLMRAFGQRRHRAAELGPVEPTVAEFLQRPQALTHCVSDHDPDYPTYGLDQIVNCFEEVPELEALHRVAMQVHNEYPWDGAEARLVTLDDVSDDDFVVLFMPRDAHVLDFLRRIKNGATPVHPRSLAREPPQPVTPFAPVVVGDRFGLTPRIESLAVLRGEHICTNEDVVRNAAHHWSPMTAESIRSKTGVEQRVYSARGLDEMAFDVAVAALEGAGREPSEIGAVVVCSCTLTRPIPSLSAWLAGQLGISQTQGAYDIVAACAGFVYGLVEAVRSLHTAQRPVLVVWAEKFSDKIGNVRTSRMLLGDAACAAVIAPGDGCTSDIEILQILAGGPTPEVNSIVWPNPEFDNNITVYGPDVRTLARRYLVQMGDEVRSLPHPEGADGSMMEAIDLIVPHQANKSMVIELAREADLDPDQLYFNIDRVGNTSSASIPLAIYDAVRDGVIDRPMRLLTPGFGAGAVGGYAIIRLDPTVVVPEQPICAL